jgi:hypothetical protein
MKPWDHFEQFETTDEHRLLVRWLMLGGDNRAMRRLVKESGWSRHALDGLKHARHWAMRREAWEGYLQGVALHAAEVEAGTHGALVAKAIGAHHKALAILETSLELAQLEQDRSEVAALEPRHAIALTFRAGQSIAALGPAPEQADDGEIDVSDLSEEELLVLKKIHERRRTVRASGRSAQRPA